MPMKKPPRHPGRYIKDACLDPLALSVTEGGKVLGVARHTLSSVINGQAGISPEMAIRLEKAGWSNADNGWECRPPTIWRKRGFIRTISRSRSTSRNLPAPCPQHECSVLPRT